MTLKRTSIILCTYNEANYIENTISELEKNIPNLEIVIVDDASTDGTAEIIRKLSQNNKYKCVKCFGRSLCKCFGKLGHIILEKIIEAVINKFLKVF